MQGLTEGRIVHYVLSENDVPSSNAGAHRPAIVVQDWDRATGSDNGNANLVVFLDGSNDGVLSHLTLWATSRHYSEDPQPGTWHWPEKV
jgi:hypothetical protein